MRWIKHLAAAHDDEKMTRVLEEFGPLAYGTFWLLCELIAQPLEKQNNRAELTHSAAKWAQKLYISARKLHEITQCLQIVGLITLFYDKDRITIGIPKLLKYRDEYSQRSGHSPDTVPPDSEYRRDETRTDEKRTDDDVQKPSSSVVVPSKTFGSFQTPSSSSKVKTMSSAPPPERIESMRRMLCSFMGEEHPPPDDQIVVKIIAACHGASDELIAVQLYNLRHKGQTPNRPNGPTTYGWFVAVFEAYFGQLARKGA